MYTLQQPNTLLTSIRNPIPPPPQLLQMLAEKAEGTGAEWLLWVDNDALFVDVTTTPPFSRYDGRDFVIWGDEEKTFVKKDAHHGKLVRVGFLGVG